MRVRRRLTIRGRVQGVGYRSFAAGAARRLGLRGWVRNRADGSVEAEVEGEAATVDSWCVELRRGPRGAAVDRIDGAGDDATGGEDLPPFEIRW